jgi:RHS repeat-associated protein
MSDKTNGQIPPVRPSQFESNEKNIFEDSVNLFRGDVNLSLDLVALTGRNQLDVKVTAFYGSNIKNEIYQSNVSAPTGIMGLGWQLPFERIEVDHRDNATPGDNLYRIYTNNASSELIRAPNDWLRAKLPIAATTALNSGKVDTEIQSAFIAAGLQLGCHAQVVTRFDDRQWEIIDPVYQRTFNVLRQDAELAVFSGGEAFECFHYDFSKVLYYPQFERWELVKDNGVSYFYGGNAQDDQSIQWKVRWGNWSGQSALTHSPQGDALQSRFAAIWNLAQVESLWGDRIAFRYEAVEQPVGERGLSFTKACYLTRITDMFDRTVDFGYQEKRYDTQSPAGPREYLSPHWDTPYSKAPGNAASAYQDRYETRYLDNIVVKNSQGTLLYAVQLSYDTQSNFSGYPQSDPLYGDTVKRTLTGVQRRYAENCALPQMQFSYWPAGTVNAGALSGAVTPDGAKIAYRYKQQTLPLCDRQRQIVSPWPRSAKPRVWFGGDYAVCLWLNESSDQIHVTFYTWLGRWQCWAPEQQTIKAAFDINSVNVVTAGDFACLTYATPQSGKSYAHVYHKDNRKWGEWFDSAPIAANTTQLQLAAGDNFFVVCDKDQRTLLRYTWDNFTKRWAIADRSGDLNATARPYIAAANGYYAVLDYAPLTGGEHRNRLALYYQDSQEQWRNGASLPLVFTLGGDASATRFGFAAGASFIALTYITQEVSLSVDYTVKVIGWDAAFGAMTSTDFPCRLPKSAPSQTLTIPFLAKFVNNAMIASGPYLLRYNGADWLRNDSLLLRSTCSDQDINWFAYGADYAIAVSNREFAAQARMVAYDPNRQITAWNDAARDLYTRDDPTSERKRHYFPTAGADIATMGNRVYHRGSWCNWLDAAAGYAEVPYAIDSTTMINQGPRFISYLNLDGTAAKNTTVKTFRNQAFAGDDTLTQRYFTQIGVSGMVKPNINGQYPAGLSAFVTYLPLNKDFDNAESLTLNRYLDNTLQGALVDYCVDTVSIDDGYAVSTTCYVFDIATATCDPTGAVFKYYKSASYPGSESMSAPRFGYRENYYFNGLTRQDPQVGERVRAADQASSGLLDGQLIEQKVFDADGNLLVHEQKNLMAFTSVAIDGVERPLFGGYTRCIADNSLNDGLAIRTDYRYDSRFGKLIRERFDNVTATGETQGVAKLYGYAFEAYPWFLLKNAIDAPFSQFDAAGSAALGEALPIYAGSLQRYGALQRQQPLADEAAPTVWAATQAYVLQAAIGAQPPSPPALASDPGDAWLPVGTILARTFYGAILSQKNSESQVESTLWDNNQILPVAAFVSGAADECDFIGFEPYQHSTDPWRLDGDTAIVDDDAYVGSRSLKLGVGATLTRTAPLRQTQPVVVSAWLKTSPGFNAAPGAANLISRSGNAAPHTTPIVPTAEGAWVYWQSVIPYSGDPERPLALAFDNQKTVGYVLFNTVSVTPLASKMEARCYDPLYLDEIAVMGNNADVLRCGYDPLRQKFVETGPQGESKKGVVNYAPRSWHDTLPFSYPQHDPASSCEILAADGGQYETFTQGEQTWTRWRRDDDSAWRLSQGRLLHCGTTLNRLRWLATAGRYAVGFTLSSPATQNLAFGLTIGDSLSAQWDAIAGWRLTLAGNTYTDDATNGCLPTSVLLVPGDDAVLLYADGRQVFALQTDARIDGEFSLQAQGEIYFANAVTFRSPQLAITYKNANRQETQHQVLNEGRCLVRETLYDALGNTVAETKIAAFERTLFGYRAAFVRTLDAANGVMTGEVSDYYPQDEGYPYSGTRYEASSLKRPVAKGMPGKIFAITGDNPHITRFIYAVTDHTQVAGIACRPGELRVSALYDADGTGVLSLNDRRGQTLSKQTEAGGVVRDAVQQIFDAAGNIVQVRHPSSSPADDAFISHNRYNFLCQLAARVTPDAGETTYIYDPAGRLRFSSTPLSRAKDRVLYKKYDVLGRLSEDGEVAQAWGDGSALQAIADNDPHYPHHDDWQTQNVYDGEGDEPTLRGRLWKMYRRAADGLCVENCYGYDTGGNATLSQLRLPDAGDYITGYAYDNLGNVIRIDYPAGAPLASVAYRYNDMGQTAAIGTPDDPEKFVRYRYHADGSLAEEQLNSQGGRALRRTMSYNSPGWLNEINNHYADGAPLLKHRFSYTDGGYEGAGYFNGNIAGVVHDNAVRPENSFAYRYRYDPRGQLTVAEHSVNSAYSLGVGAPLTFDAGGNILRLQQGDTLFSYEYQPNSGKVAAVLANDAVAQRYEYDVVGNVTLSASRGIQRIDYNPLNNLPLTIALDDGRQLALCYNGINQRVQKRFADGSKLAYVHGLSDAPLMEFGARTTQYLYGVGGLLLLIDGGEAQYVLKDQQGSIRAVVAENGQVNALLDYMPFGQSLPTGVGTSSLLRYRYTGQELDEDLGLYNYRARFYDPQLGRFYSCDPRFQYGGPYVYCGNNPVNQTDPSGEIAPIIIILLIGAAVGAVLGGGVALYSGYQSGLRGGALAGYVFAGAGIGALAGALSAAGGVGAFAAGSAAAAAASTTAGGIAAGLAAGAGVGATVGAAVGAAQGVSQFFINDAFGVANSGSWQQSLLKGAVTGAVGGAISGGAAGVGGAAAFQQAARFAELTGGNGWAFSPTSLTQVSNAYNAFGSLGIVPLPAFVSRIPNYNLPLVGGMQSFVLGKFSLPTFSSLGGAVAKQAVSPLLPSGGGTATGTPPTAFYGQQAYSPAMTGSIGLQTALVLDPAGWSNGKA